MDLGLQERSKLCVEEAVYSIRNKPAKSTMLERLRIFWAADDAVSCLTQPLQLGNGLLYIAKNVGKPVSKHDILLARIPEEVPDEDGERFISKYIEEKERFPFTKPVWLVDGGHLTFAWDELVELGISGLLNKAQKKLDQLKSENAPWQSIEFLTGKTLIYKALIEYMLGFADAATAEGLNEEAEICKYIAANPPKTFRQAMQLILFVGVFFSIYTSIIGALSYGRLDKILLPLYLNDLKSGEMTREEMGYVIKDFCCKNNLILGRGEHQMAMLADFNASDEKTTGWLRNPNYDNPLYVILGGYPDKESYLDKQMAFNPLTVLFVESYDNRFKNPVLIYRHCEAYNQETYDLICINIMKNASIICYNDESMIKAFINIGISEEDAVDYTIHSCNWPDVSSKHATIRYLTSNLAEIVRSTLLDENEKLRKDFRDIDQFYDQIFNDYRKIIKEVFDAQRTDLDNMPRPGHVITCADCFLSGTSDNIYSISSGGTKYITMYNQLKFPGSAIDAVIAIDQLVFREKQASLSELATAMASDFEGYENIRNKCKHAEKYGSDSELSDYHTERFMSGIVEILNQEAVNPTTGKKDVLSINTLINDMNHVHHSIFLGATADGRKREEFLSENMSPAVRIKNGSLTALFNSVLKFPFDKLCGGVLNVKIRKSIFKGESGLELLENIMNVYFAQGGMQLQFSLTDTAELLDAQLHPENYKDLMVRVTGYSAIFIDMCPRSQKEMITRSELG